ncbi:MAG: hypothetical protein WBE32_11815 [Pseudolabrys sp.]
MAVGIGRWRSAATVVLVLAVLASLSLELPAEAAVTMALSVGISPSMEATRRDWRCPLLAKSGHGTDVAERELAASVAAASIGKTVR